MSDSIGRFVFGALVGAGICFVVSQFGQLSPLPIAAFIVASGGASVAIGSYRDLW